MNECFWSGYAVNNLYPFCEQQLCSAVVEPANTWSNIGYLLAAFFIFKNTAVKNLRVKNFFALSTLCLFVGSTAMHASGTYWGKIADVSAMFFLSNVILILALERSFKLKEYVANLVFVVTFSLSVVFLLVTGFGGKLFLLQLLVAAALEYRMKNLRVENILKACAIFAAAFAFWLLDTKKILCWPQNHILTGHALWHLLCAAAIWVYFLAYREKTSATYCTLPWMHTYLHTDGSVGPCCLYRGKTGDVNEASLSDNWNSEPMKKIRREMLSGIEPKGCEACFTQERLGNKSYRQNSLEYSPDIPLEEAKRRTRPDGTVKNFKLQSADFRFSNLCNFKCRSCNPEFSSSIAAEQKHTKLATPGPRGQAISELSSHYASLRKIYFAGGEPLLQKEHWQIIRELSDQGRASSIDLSYSTNGSLLSLKENDAIKIWKNFRTVAVWFSVDAMGAEAEYWRSGTVWSEIEKNILRVREATVTYPWIVYCVKSTLSWPNLHAWIRMVKYLLENKIITELSQFDYSLVEGPEELSLQSVPKFKKQEFKAALEDFKRYLTGYFSEDEADSKVRGVISFMMKTDLEYKLHEFRNQFELDRLRGQDFFSVFPEHENMRLTLKENIEAEWAQKPQ